jgi:hypothetical protein
MARLADELSKGGQNDQAIARAVNDLRNQMRQDAWKLMDPKQIEEIKARQRREYGNEIGPSADDLFAKKGSWAAVIEGAFKTNPHTDSMYNPNEQVIPFAPLWDDN